MNEPIISFNAGEFTEKIDIRSDTSKYASGCRKCENLIPIIYGGLERRPGTRYLYKSREAVYWEGSLVTWESAMVTYE